jgi:hypothetical protein
MEFNFIISLTTLPSRYDSLKQCLKSLFEQNYSNYEIHLNIPKNNNFEGPYTHELDFNNERLKIYYIDDIGPISKIYYTLERTKNRNQRIISVDDDIIYNKDMLKVYNMILSNNNYLDCCIGFAGILPLNNGAWDNTILVGGNNKIPIYVGILEGYKSICYKRDFFDDDFFTSVKNKDMEWAYDTIYYEDDVVISSYLGYKKIMKVVMPPEFINKDRKGIINKCISFPIVKLVKNKLSGCNIYRNEYGDAINNIKEFYISDFGKYIRNDDLKAIKIGSSEENTKIIQLDKIYPSNTRLIFIHTYVDTFSYKFNNKELSITRTDKTNSGWGQNLVGYF